MRGTHSPSSARPIFAAFALMALCVIGLLPAPESARASEESEAFVQRSVDTGYEILNSTTLSDEERSKEFFDFMVSLTDMRRIALFTLGPYVNRASEAEIDDFVEAFTDYAVTIYEDRLSRYTGQTMRVTGSTDRAADDSVVSAVVYTPDDPVSPNTQSLNVAFRVREDANGNPIVIDMQAEGVWIAVNQRADFTSFLQQNNGSLPALSSSLRRQIDGIRNRQSQ
jgi:phospholipid transport system substrate-binding protein